MNHPPSLLDEPNILKVLFRLPLSIVILEQRSIAEYMDVVFDSASGLYSTGINQDLRLGL
jgi:hypothetical protein